MTCAALFVLCLFAPQRAAGDQDPGALRGVPAIRVVIEDLSADAESVGLTRSQLQTEVEERLRAAGIRVSDKPEPPALAMVYVTASLARSPEMISYIIRVQLTQTATLLSGRRYPVAVTWDTAAFGTAGESRAKEEMTGKVRDMADKFAGDYRAVNPNPRPAQCRAARSRRLAGNLSAQPAHGFP